MLSDLPCTDRVWRAGRAVPRDWPASESSLRGGTREPSTTSVRCVDVLAASSPGRCGHLETHTTPSAGHHAELSDSCGDSPEQLDSRRWGRRAGGRPPGRQSRATACRRASGTRADLCARWSAAARHFRNRSATPRRSPGWRRLHVPPLQNGATRTSNW